MIDKKLLSNFSIVVSIEPKWQSFKHTHRMTYIQTTIYNLHIYTQFFRFPREKEREEKRYIFIKHNQPNRKWLMEKKKKVCERKCVMHFTFSGLYSNSNSKYQAWMKSSYTRATRPHCSNEHEKKLMKIYNDTIRNETKHPSHNTLQQFNSHEDPNVNDFVNQHIVYTCRAVCVSHEPKKNCVRGEKRSREREREKTSKRKRQKLTKEERANVEKLKMKKKRKKKKT